MATNTTPAAWMGESDAILSTVIDIFRVRAETITEQRRRIG